MNTAFRLVDPVYNMDTNLFKVTVFTETEKQSPNTGARANNTLHTKLGYPIGEPARQSECDIHTTGYI